MALLRIHQYYIIINIHQYYAQTERILKFGLADSYGRRVHVISVPFYTIAQNALCTHIYSSVLRANKGKGFSIYKSVYDWG